MPITKQRIERLETFGLGTYEARAYLALLDLGTTEARDVATLSRIPSSKIYGVFEKLEDRGLLTVLPEHPKKYAPVPFAQFLRKIRDEHVGVARTIERDMDTLSREFSATAAPPTTAEGGFLLSRGRRAVHERLVPLLDSAERDLFAFMTRGSLRRFRTLREPMERAAKRGVRIRVMAPVEKRLEERLVELSRFATVRTRDVAGDPSTANVAIYVADGAQAIIVHHHPDDSNARQGRDVGIYADHDAAVGAIRAILGSAWSQSVALETRLAVIERGEPQAALLRSLDANEGRLMRILNAVASWGVADGVAILDRRGRLAFATGAGEELMKRLDAAARRPPGSSRGGASEDLPHRRALGSGEAVRGTRLRLRLEDGSLLSLVVNAVPVKDAGSVTGVVVSFVSVPERDATEETLIGTGGGGSAEVRMRGIVPDARFR